MKLGGVWTVRAYIGIYRDGFWRRRSVGLGLWVNWVYGLEVDINLLWVTIIIQCPHGRKLH